MKIKVVLERVFNVCSMESLRNCRLVSRQWRDESMKAWRDKAVLKCSLPSFFKDDENQNDFNFKDYLQLLESSKADDDDDAKLRDLKQYPFRRLSLFAADRLYDFSKGLSGLSSRISQNVHYLKIRRCSERPGILRVFLEKFHSLEILHFESCDMERLYNVNEGGICKLPKLRRLKIINDVKTDLRFWEILLQWCPNQEVFSFVYEDAEKDGSTETLEHVEGIFSTLGENSKMNLKELELCLGSAIIRRIAEGDADSFKEMNYSFKTIIRSIVESKFPLERLTINLGWEDIHRLLKSCKGTLKYLKTSFHCNLDRYTSPYGSSTNWKLIEVIKYVPAVPIRMRQLKEASLGSGHIRAFSLLTHLKLPSLEKLIIEKEDSDMMADVRNVQVSFPKGRIYKRLGTLEFLDDLKMPLPQTVESLAVMMPNLIHLTIPLDKATFPIVCKKLNCLKTLNILSAVSAQIRFEELDGKTLTGVSEGNGDGGPRCPNITNLKLLTEFKISCESQLLGNDVKFTDHSVIHGFLLLPHLYSLSIAFKDLSEAVKDKLFSRVKGNVYFQEKSPLQNHSIVGIRDGDEDAMNEGSGDSESEEEEEDDWHGGSSNSENESDENETGDDFSASESEDE